MSRDQVEHEPVLCEPLLELAAPTPGQIAVDATVGHGGHAQLLAERIGPKGRLIGLDVDPHNLERARRKLQAAIPAAAVSILEFGILDTRSENSDSTPQDSDTGATSRPGQARAVPGGGAGAGLPVTGPRIELVRGNFSDLESVLDALGVQQVDLLLADLGVSTDQLLDDALGLSFTSDAPLDMRLDDRLEHSAADLVNALTESELSDLVFFNSQERFSRRIAKRICQVRREGRIRRTSELVRIVCSALGVSPHSHPGKLHPATRTFLALRMAVNHELENLRALLAAAPRRLTSGGRLAVISFHSGEDRIVKQNLLDQQRAGVYEIRTKKPVAPTSEELRRNPRSRSAKLRVAARTHRPLT